MSLVFWVQMLWCNSSGVLVYVVLHRGRGNLIGLDMREDVEWINGAVKDGRGYKGVEVGQAVSLKLIRQMPR